MTTDIADAVLDPATPEYDAQHELIHAADAFTTLAHLIAQFDQIDCDFEIPEETPESAYPTVTQIEADLDEFERQNAPQPELIEAQ